MPTQPAASNSPERKRASYTRETQSVSILSSLTLEEVSSLGREREREKRGVHFAKVYSLGKGCSFSPESLYHLSLLFLNINYLSCHLITEPKRYLVYPSYLHRPFPLSRCLFCKYCSEKGHGCLPRVILRYFWLNIYTLRLFNAELKKIV